MSAAGRLYAAGGVLLAVMPLAMVLANRSSPLICGLAALAFLAGRWAEDAAALRRHLLGPLRTPLAGAALAFLAWALISLAWSPFPAVPPPGRSRGRWKAEPLNYSTSHTGLWPSAKHSAQKTNRR